MRPPDPPTPDNVPAVRQTNIRVTDELDARIDAEVARQGLRGRAELVRAALHYYFGMLDGIRGETPAEPPRKKRS